MLVNGNRSRGEVLLINNPTKAKTLMDATGTEEESERHQEVLEKRYLR